MSSTPSSEDETFDFGDLTIPPANDATDEATLQPREIDDFETLRPEESTLASPPVGTKVRYFGDYELLTEIARGGMGVVYRAKQNKLNRIVALKMILAGQFASDEDIQRFYTEAEAAAKLDHAGIVPIFEVGQYQGQHFFSMGFVEGQSLSDRLRNGPLPPKEAAELLQRITEAIAYAHSQGVIHRDLKPANVLLDKQGNPKVTDFRLAKNLESESGLTRTSSVMGTPSYMPPEQAGGANEQVGPRSDVYSLGAMLYCLVTGRPPFQAANPLDTLLQVMSAEPVSPRQLNPQVPKDLETICLKCLQKEPSRRYASADALAADLGRFLRAEPIHARSISRSERTWRWCKRNPVVASLLAVSVTLLLVSLWSLRGESLQRKTAVAQTTKAQAAESNAREQESLAKTRLADQIEQAKEDSTALLSYGISENRNQRLESGSENLIRALRLRGEDDSLKESYGRVLSDWLTRGGRCFLRLRHESYVHCVEFSPDGNCLVTVSYDSTARLWNAKTGASIGQPMLHEGTVSDAAFSPDGSRVGTTSYDNTARLWDAQTGALLGEPMQHEYLVVSVAFSPDGYQMVTASDNKVYLWDAQVRSMHVESINTGEKILSVAFSPDGTRFATASADKTARLWDAKTGEPIGEAMRHEAGVRSVAFSPDGTRIATAWGFEDLFGLNNIIHVWNAQTGASMGDLMRHESEELSSGNGVFSVAFSPDGTSVATADGDKTARLWDAQTGAPLGTPINHESEVNSVAFSPDGIYLATASVGAKLWDVEAIVPKNIPALINRFAKEPDPSIPPDTEYQAVLDAFQARRNLRYRATAAIKAVADKNWFAAKFHLPWLIEQEPNNPRWQIMLAKTLADHGKIGALQDGSFELPLDEAWQVTDYMQVYEVVETSDADFTVGKKSLLVKATRDTGSDVQCFQTITVLPNTNYRLSGMVKTQDVAVAQEGGTTGASLSVEDIGITDSILGTADWTKLSYEFNTGDRTQIRIGPRLGHNGSMCTGTAWFDDLHLEVVGTAEVVETADALQFEQE